MGKGTRALKRYLDDARTWRKLAGFWFWCFTALWIVAEFTGWVNDPAFISRVSMVALQLACLSWWQSGRVEVKQQDDADVKDVLEKMDE